MNTAATIVGLILVLVAIGLAPLAASHLQRNGLITAINSSAILQDTGNIASGLVYASNEARFESSHYDTPLTAYTVGWRDPENLDALREALFPGVEVPRWFSWKSAENSEAFLSEDDDERTIGSGFKKVETTGKSVTAKTVNRGLTTRVDHDEALSKGWEERKVAWLLARITRNSLRRCLALLDAGANSSALTWDADSNPDGDMRKVLRDATDKSGMRPSIVAIGELAWDTRLDVYESQNTPYAGAAASKTPEQLAMKYMVDRVLPVKARYQSTATQKASLVASVLYAYLAFAGADKDDPSNFKRFYSLTQQGTKHGVYIERKTKFTDITVEYYESPTVTSTLGIEKRAVAAL